MGDELCLQSMADSRIEPLVTTLAPSCLPVAEVISTLQALLNDALARVQPGVGQRSGQHCQEVEIVPPPPPAVSLEPIYRLGSIIPPSPRTVYPV
jgi:hypothetical protein